MGHDLLEYVSAVSFFRRVVAQKREGSRPDPRVRRENQTRVRAAWDSRRQRGEGNGPKGCRCPETCIGMYGRSLAPTGGTERNDQPHPESGLLLMRFKQIAVELGCLS